MKSQLESLCISVFDLNSVMIIEKQIFRERKKKVLFFFLWKMIWIFFQELKLSLENWFCVCKFEESQIIWEQQKACTDLDKKQ